MATATKAPVTDETTDAPAADQDVKEALDKGAKTIREAHTKATKDGNTDDLSDIIEVAKAQRDLAREFDAGTLKLTANQLAAHQAVIGHLQRYVDGEIATLRREINTFREEVRDVVAEVVINTDHEFRKVDKRLTLLETPPGVVVPSIIVGIIAAIVWALLGFHNQAPLYQIVTTALAGVLGFFGTAALIVLLRKKSNDTQVESVQATGSTRSTPSLPQPAATDNPPKAVGANADSPKQKKE